MTNAASPHHDLRTTISTARPAELRMMLLDGAVRFARRAAQAIDANDDDAAFEGATRAQAILMELTNALDPGRDPDLYDRLRALYTYIVNRLVRGLEERDRLVLDEAVRLLNLEAETWRTTLTGENQAAGGSVPHEQSAEAPEVGMLSVTG